MKIGDQISVTLTSGQYAGKTLLLDVEEFLPIEPSACDAVPESLPGIFRNAFQNEADYIRDILDREVKRKED